MMPFKDVSDEQLVDDCRAGDQRAWDALVDRYSRLVYSVAARYQLPADEAADVFQGVWLDLYRDLSNLQRPGSLRSWLLTAASRRCLLHKQRRRRDGASQDPAIESADQRPDPLALQQQAEKEQALFSAIERLPARCQTLVRILFFEQPPVSYAEAAKRLGLAEGSIGFIRGRCLEKLRRQLKSEGWQE